MISGQENEGKWTQRPNSSTAPAQSDTFRRYFEHSPDAIWLMDPTSGLIIDCNESAVRMMRCSDRNELLQLQPSELSPPFQPDGTPSDIKSAEVAAHVSKHGSLRFEWTVLRRDGTEVPLEVLATDVTDAGRSFHVVVSRDITERKRADEQVRQFRATLENVIAERTAELRASEERFRTIVEHAPESIVVLDGTTGNFLLCNENATRLFGLSRAELLGHSPADLSPIVQPNGRFSLDLIKEHVDAAVNGEAPSFEWVHKHSSGRLLTCEVRLLRLPGSGHPLIRGSVIDTTERNRRERIQRATYEIAAAVLTTDDLGALYQRIHAIIKGLMPAYNFYIALLDPVTEMVSFPYYVDLLADSPPAPRRITTGLTGHVLRTGKPLMLKRDMTRRRRLVDEGVLIEGLELPYIESGRPAAVWLGVPLALGGKTFGVMAVQDYEDDRAYGEPEKEVLTFIAAQTALAIDRKRNEQALRESEEKFRALFEASSQGVMLHDENALLEVNPATCRIVGFPAEELIGRHPAAISAPVQMNGEPAAELAGRYIQQCMRDGHARFEWLGATPQGKIVPLEVILTRIQMGGRQIMQAVINDITERKLAEEELLKALAREKELGQLKSNFVSMVSHEFRTPLGIIMSSADILLDYIEQLEPEERQRHLKSIHKNTRRMGKLMEEVLLLGKLDAGKMQCQPERIDLRAVLQRITNENIAATGGRCPVLLNYEADETEVLADDRLLHHIFHNVIGNAIKYSEPESPVEITVRQEGRDAVCCVRDRGIGIPEADQAWLFNSFHRGSNVGQRAGTGLGLVIVKRCIDLHGGSINIESVNNAGTTVTVRLPVFVPAE